MLGPPPLPRNLDAALRDLASARPEIRASAIEDAVRHARGDDSVRTRAVGLLGKLLADENARVRAAAAIGLGDLQADEQVDALVTAIDDDDPHVRQMALNALGEIRDARALPRVRRALKEPRPEVRYQAVIAFTRISKEVAEIEQAVLDATNESDDAIAHIALRIAEERLDAGHAPEERLLARARALVKKGSPHVALAAAILLAKSGDDSVHKMLLGIVDGGRIRGAAPEKEDERAAVELMGELRLEAAVPALERRAFGLARHIRDTCPFHAKIALARMGHVRAVAEILKDLDATRPDVLGAAVVAAGRARLAQAREKLERLTSAAVDPELVKEALRRLDETEKAPA